jgi:hypothetical protein
VRFFTRYRKQGRIIWSYCVFYSVFWYGLKNDEASLMTHSIFWIRLRLEKWHYDLLGSRIRCLWTILSHVRALNIVGRIPRVILRSLTEEELIRVANSVVTRHRHVIHRPNSALSWQSMKSLVQNSEQSIRLIESMKRSARMKNTFDWWFNYLERQDGSRWAVLVLPIHLLIDLLFDSRSICMDSISTNRHRY